MMEKIDVINRKGEKIGTMNLEKARQILVQGQGTFHFEDGKYIIMIYTDEKFTTLGGFHG